MIKTTNYLIVFSIMLCFYITSPALAKEQSYKIIKLVNDQVITNYDLEKRLNLFSFLNNVTINNENMQRYNSEMLKLMVDEKLKLEQIKLYGVKIEKNEIEEYISSVFLASNENLLDLTENLNSNNIDINILYESIKIQLGWNKLAGRLFYRNAEINDIDLIKIMEQDTTLGKDQAKNILIQDQINLRAKKFLRDLRIEANIENR